MTARDLAATYRKTVVTVQQGEDSVWVPVEESAIATRHAIHILTAWNPGDARPSEAENRTANERLRQLLVGRGLTPIPALGSDPDSGHFEESWAVAGLTDAEAREIGADFGQVAVFRIGAGEQAVLACAENWIVTRPLAFPSPASSPAPEVGEPFDGRGREP